MRLGLLGFTDACVLVPASSWCGLVSLASYRFLQFICASVVDCCLCLFLGVAGLVLSTLKGQKNTGSRWASKTDSKSM